MYMGKAKRAHTHAHVIFRRWTDREREREREGECANVVYRKSYIKYTHTHTHTPMIFRTRIERKRDSKFVNTHTQKSNTFLYI